MKYIILISCILLQGCVNVPVSEQQIFCKPPQIKPIDEKVGLRVAEGLECLSSNLKINRGE